MQKSTGAFQLGQNENRANFVEKATTELVDEIWSSENGLRFRKRLSPQGSHYTTSGQSPYLSASLLNSRCYLETQKVKATSGLTINKKTSKSYQVPGKC